MLLTGGSRTLPSMWNRGFMPHQCAGVSPSESQAAVRQEVLYNNEKRNTRQDAEIRRRLFFGLGTVLGVDSNHSFQPSFFSKTDCHFARVFGGFLERRIPGKNAEVTPRKVWFDDMGVAQN